MNHMTRISAVVFLAGAFTLGGGVAQAADSYGFDKEHTKILFAYNHVGLSMQYGRFGDFDGQVVFDQENPANSKVDVTIKAASIDTWVPALDDHLRSADFFDVEKFPEITFRSTEIRRTGKNTGQVVGDLTIKENTKPVVLDVTFNFAGEHPLSPYLDKYKGAQYASFSAQTKILRSDFGVEQFAPLTSDEIEIIIETELRKTE